MGAFYAAYPTGIGPRFLGPAAFAVANRRTRSGPAPYYPVGVLQMNRFDWTFSGSAEFVTGALLALLIVVAAFS